MNHGLSLGNTTADEACAMTQTLGQSSYKRSESVLGALHCDLPQGAHNHQCPDAHQKASSTKSPTLCTR